jgi:hypothetical protein
MLYSASADVVERFSLSLASTGLNCHSLHSFTSSTQRFIDRQAGSLVSSFFFFGVGDCPIPFIALGPAFKERQI